MVQGKILVQLCLMVVIMTLVIPNYVDGEWTDEKKAEVQKKKDKDCLKKRSINWDKSLNIYTGAYCRVLTQDEESCKCVFKDCLQNAMSECKKRCKIEGASLEGSFNGQCKPFRMDRDHHNCVCTHSK